MEPQQPQQLQDPRFSFTMGPNPGMQAPSYQWAVEDEDEDGHDNDIDYWSRPYEGTESSNQLPSTSNYNSTQFMPFAPPSYPPPQSITTNPTIPTSIPSYPLAQLHASRAAPTANPTVASSVHQETHGFDVATLQSLLRQRMETPLTVMLIYKLMLRTY